MKYQKKRLILLHHIPFLSRKMIRTLLSSDPTLQNIFTFTPKAIHEIIKLPMQKATTLYNYLQDEQFHQLVKEQLFNIKIVTIFDDLYPETLKHIPDAPLVLYCLGNVKLLNKRPSISVIGTRRPSLEANKKIKFILTPLIENNWTIVSGLAYGIDRLSHIFTLEQNGDTIAVLGNGFYHPYPRENKALQKKIAQTGLVITEYPPNTPPKRYHFPERNRIVSGLTEATLVIEAMEKSGTSITVDQALDQGKEVYAVPGSIFSAQTIGCHRMIQDGAKLVMSATDILEDFS